MITGRVIDAETGAPLIGAHVFQRAADGVPVGTITDTAGRYQLSLVNNSPLYFSFVGYRGQEQTTPAAFAEINAALAPGLSLPPVVITPDSPGKMAGVTWLLLAAFGLFALSRK